jgi:hypothetical protein
MFACSSTEMRELTMHDPAVADRSSGARSGSTRSCADGMLGTDGAGMIHPARTQALHFS